MKRVLYRILDNKFIGSNIDIFPLLLGVIIFAFFIVTIYNFSNKLNIIIQYKDNKPFCIDVDKENFFTNNFNININN